LKPKRPGKTLPQTLDAVKIELKNTTEAIRGMITKEYTRWREARTAAKEAVEVGKANLEMTRQMRNT
jgi:hypothetical protein